jgi:hypothetical protein
VLLNIVSLAIHVTPHSSDDCCVNYSYRKNQMKNSSAQASKADSIPTMQPSHSSLFGAIRSGMKNLFKLLDQMGTAIALGENGDLEGAKKLRDKYAQW